MCAYCIVPFTRGRERSRPIDSILREVEMLSQQATGKQTHHNSFSFIIVNLADDFKITGSSRGDTSWSECQQLSRLVGEHDIFGAVSSRQRDELARRLQDGLQTESWRETFQ